MSDDIQTVEGRGSNRRTFLRAGTMTAVVAGAAVTGRSAAQAAPPAPSTAPGDLTAAATAAGPTIFYVRDALQGQIGALVGDREVLVTDKAAVLTILTAAGR